MGRSIEVTVRRSLRLVAEKLSACAGQKLVLSLEEAGARIGRSPAWFVRMEASGRVQLARRGRAISRSELLRLVAEGASRLSSR